MALGAAWLILGAPAASAAPPYPDSNTSPQIHGPEPRQEGQTLSSSPGSWTPAPQSSMTFAYQWLRCTASGAGCEAIPGATGDSYAVAPGDIGRRLKLRVTGNCTLPAPICQPAARDSEITGTVLPDPNNEAAPQISGSPSQGQVLTGSFGFWRSVAPLRFSYQWLRCDRRGGSCENVSGARVGDYRLTASDVGHTMRLSVTARNNRPRTGVAVSAPTRVVREVAAPRAPQQPRRGVRLLSPFPTIVLAGVVTRSGARLSEFSVRGPRGSLVTIRCHGRGCPFRTKRFRVRAVRVRVRALERRLRGGLLLVVSIEKRGFIGKYSTFRIRRGRVPRRSDLCLMPGAKRPTRCPGA